MAKNNREKQIKIEQAQELNVLFQEAAERGNFGMIDQLVNELAYGTEHILPNPPQAFVLLKAKARLLDPENIEFDNTLCFMAELIGDNDVNPGNKAVLASITSQDSGTDLLQRIAEGDFKAIDENGRDFTIGFDEFEPQQTARIIRYSKQALKEIHAWAELPTEFYER